MVCPHTLPLATGCKNKLATKLIKLAPLRMNFHTQHILLHHTLMYDQSYRVSKLWTMQSREPCDCLPVFCTQAVGLVVISSWSGQSTLPIYKHTGLPNLSCQIDQHKLCRDERPDSAISYCLFNACTWSWTLEIWQPSDSVRYHLLKLQSLFSLALLLSFDLLLNMNRNHSTS